MSTSEPPTPNFDTEIIKSKPDSSDTYIIIGIIVCVIIIIIAGIYYLYKKNPKFPPDRATKRNSLDTVINTTLVPGQSITSPSGKTSLTMQPDGNLVMTVDKKIVASTKTSTKGGAKAVLRSDTTLAVLDSAGNVVFSTNKPSFYSTRNFGPNISYNFDPQYLLEVDDGGNILRIQNNMGESGSVSLPKV
jgi:hypothetical protein